MNINEIVKSLPRVEEFANSIRSKAEQELDSMGIPSAVPPDVSDLSYPSDVTEITTADVSHRLSKYAQLSGYLQFLMGQKEADIKYLESILSHLKKSLSSTLKKAEIDAHPSVMTLYVSIAEQHVVFNAIKARYEFFDACAKALSRELTRRTAESRNL